GCLFVKEFFEQMIGNKFDNYHRDNQERAPSKNIGDLEADACRGSKAAIVNKPVCTVNCDVPSNRSKRKLQRAGTFIRHRNRSCNAVAVEKRRTFYRQEA